MNVATLVAEESVAEGFVSCAGDGTLSSWDALLDVSQSGACQGQKALMEIVGFSVPLTWCVPPF